jgi:hypothetical protein
MQACRALLDEMNAAIPLAPTIHARNTLHSQRESSAALQIYSVKTAAQMAARQ